jgi:hypothetical protein
MPMADSRNRCIVIPVLKQYWCNPSVVNAIDDLCMLEGGRALAKFLMLDTLYKPNYL